MFNRTNLLIVLVAIVGAAFGLLVGTQLGGRPDVPLPPGMIVLKPGDTRADLALPDADGKPRRLSEWDGQLVLLNFWATWCGPCRDEMPLLDHARGQYPGLQVVGIALDDPEAVTDFLKESPVRYPILVAADTTPSANPSLQFGDRQNVLPFSVLIGRDGKVVAQRAGSFSQASLATWIAKAGAGPRQ